VVLEDLSSIPGGNLEVARTKKAAEIEKKVKICPRGALTVPA
jgi:hypothetical protein